MSYEEHQCSGGISKDGVKNLMQQSDRLKKKRKQTTRINRKSEGTNEDRVEELTKKKRRINIQQDNQYAKERKSNERRAKELIEQEKRNELRVGRLAQQEKGNQMRNDEKINGAREEKSMQGKSIN